MWRPIAVPTYVNVNFHFIASEEWKTKNIYEFQETAERGREGGIRYAASKTTNFFYGFSFPSATISAGYVNNGTMSSKINRKTIAQQWAIKRAVCVPT